jgi:hypothetical protein
LIASLGTAGPAIGVLVDAHLVQLWRVDSIKPVRHIAELKGATILDDRARGPNLARRENRQHHD